MSALLTRLSAQERASDFDIERLRRHFPSLAREGSWQAAGLPGQRRDQPEAPSRHRRAGALLRDRTTPTSTAACTTSPSERRTAYEGARAKVRRFLNAARRAARSSSCAAPPRRSTWSPELRRSACSARATRCSSPRWSTTRTSCPGRCSAKTTGARLRVAPINDAGELALDEFEQLLGPRTRLVAVAHVSNALGTINPGRGDRRSWRTRAARRVLVDGAQAVPHLPVDVQALGCDFYAFSGHKMFGPTGIGVLYGRSRAARGDAALPGRRRHDPLGQLREDRLQRAAAQVRGRHARHRRRRRSRRGHRLPRGAGPRRASQRTSTSCSPTAPTRSPTIPGLRLIGTARAKASVLSFILDGIHPHDIGTILDREGIAIRAGHHCAQPLMERLGVAATARASLALYNTRPRHRRAGGRAAGRCRRYSR